MAKKAAKKQPSQSTAVEGEVPVVGAREACPCGSGRRYKACHGRQAAHAVQELVHRPFEGLPGEADWVALRELVPAATVPLVLAAGVADEAVGEVPSVTLATVLPLAWPALRRPDGSILLGLQTQSSSGDLSRDLADALELALATEPGTPVPARRTNPGGRRLQELLDTTAAFVPEVHTGFEFWLEDAESATGEVAASLERANASAIPTEKLAGVDSAYWCGTPDKNHLRWVMDVPEEQLLDALSRLSAAGDSSLGEGTKLVGSFRAHGLTVPVWDLPLEMTAADVEKPAVEFAGKLAAVLAAPAPLTAEERRARANLVSRQITLN
ncbi:MULTISPECIES: DUF5926 family protein [Kitasatospora]|uniref:SEC-C motif-containing protein n=1 Tax=Kitasatospora cineracea TaxID=88074 RepID=A0A3N4RRM1_9ACTN|nr:MULTISPECIES: DUF5926 family protein [Kitasatospora]ROR43357.1 SEC-C motif-containing protein [Kitasatospora cineracea]RPE33729.1 SEC-C motif-containing protein [Kitasatospora cineracea]WAL72770.1 DUF5926 family protein [Kitasatospora sp. YST-16]WNW38822.1 DUF5926 family protein [Streptomyces sp. Li-HN-5-13]